MEVKDGEVANFNFNHTGYCVKILMRDSNQIYLGVPRIDYEHYDLDKLLSKLEQKQLMVISIKYYPENYTKSNIEKI